MVPFSTVPVQLYLLAQGHGELDYTNREEQRAMVSADPLGGSMKTTHNIFDEYTRPILL